MRLFPDYVVTFGVLSSVNRVLKWYEIGDEDPAEKLLEKFSKLEISLRGCQDTQIDVKSYVSYTTFLGYGDEMWGEDDYKEYFESQKELFRIEADKHDTYSLDLEKIDDNHGMAVKEYVKKIKDKLLTQGVYYPGIVNLM